MADHLESTGNWSRWGSKQERMEKPPQTAGPLRLVLPVTGENPQLP